MVFISKSDIWRNFVKFFCDNFAQIALRHQILISNPSISPFGDSLRNLRCPTFWHACAFRRSHYVLLDTFAIVFIAHPFSHRYNTQ